MLILLRISNEEHRRMNCPYCVAATTRKRAKKTKLGYAIFSVPGADQRFMREPVPLFTPLKCLRNRAQFEPKLLGEHHGSRQRSEPSSASSIFPLGDASLSSKRARAFSDGRRAIGSDDNGMGFGKGASHPTRSLVPPRIILPHGTLFVPIFLPKGKIIRGAMRSNS
jgi:hypothetical protein